ncbi:MAG: hypothetical protein KGK09_04995, partial [Burkholderiales bacterium]|nr:hypothetical protein [Burkholderiales bacterium]
AVPGGAAAGAYGPGVGVPPAPGGGLLGTGLAVAGGVAAGMLAERLFDGRGGASPAANATGLFPGLNPGSVDSGTIDDSAQRALLDNPVDFGNGGDTWDSGADPGGAGDAGGGSDGW